MRKNDSMKKLIFLLMLSLCAGAVQAQVKFETKSTDAVREMAVKQGSWSSSTSTPTGVRRAG